MHALPFLEEVRRQLPNAKIGWVAEELGATLLENNPALDKLYVIPKKKWRGNYHRLFFSDIRPFFKKIYNDGWGATVDLQGITKSGVVSRSVGAAVRVGFSGKNSREINRLFNNRRIEPAISDIHVVEQNLRLLEGLGLVFPEKMPRGEIAFREQETSEIKEMLYEAGWEDEPLIGVNPGAGFPSKLWPVEHYAHLAERISLKYGVRPLIFWGPGEEEYRDTLLESLKSLGAFTHPMTTVRQMACMIKSCRMLMGGDTGPSQLAGLVGVPVLTVFGSTPPERNQPWTGDLRGKDDLSIQRRDLECCPCWNRRCPLEGKDFMACLNGLNADTVYAEAEPWIEQHLKDL